MTQVAEVVLNILKASGVACALWITGWVVALLSRKAVSVVLSRVGFDEWVKKLNLGKVIRRTGYFPSEFFGLMAYWIIIAVFLLLGIMTAAFLVGYQELVFASYTVLTVYLGGVLKMLLVVFIGFILVDSFIGYVYKSTELRAEMQVFYPLGEYLRIVLYIAVVIYALEQSGIGVGVLTQLLVPVIWGVTAVIILIIVYLMLQSLRTPTKTTM